MRKFFLSTAAAVCEDHTLAAIGVVLTDPQGRSLEKLGKCIGRATLEIAEYRAILEGLELALRYAPEELVLFIDSHRMINQLRGAFSPRDPALQHLNKIAQELLERFPRARVNYVDHEANRIARRLAEQALYQERRTQREREFLRREILAVLEEFSLEELRRVLSLLHSLGAEKSDAYRSSAGA